MRTGIIVRRTRSHYHVDVGEDVPRLCRIRSTLFHQEPRESRIAVGDEVLVDLEVSKDTGWILERLPRRTSLTRRVADGIGSQVLVSNADTLLIVSALNRPKYRFGVIDRLLVVGLQGGLRPLLVFNKTDLAGVDEKEVPVGIYRQLGYTVLQTSVPEESGLEDLRKQLKDRKSVLCGHSGVGKSSLIKALYPNWSIRIGEVKRKQGTGRHTTIMTCMYALPEGGYLVDTPGVRELMPFKLPRKELGKYFVEFQIHQQLCRFKSCSHLKEPECGVKDALEQGRISRQRYMSYCAIYESLPE